MGRAPAGRRGAAGCMLVQYTGRQTPVLPVSPVRRCSVGYHWLVAGGGRTSARHSKVRRAACRCNTQAGRHRCYRCHRCAGALSAITGWLRAVGRTSARHGKVRRAACRCNTQAGRHRCHRCCRCHR
jgi:hypothetical protein